MLHKYYNGLDVTNPCHSDIIDICGDDICIYHYYNRDREVLHMVTRKRIHRTKDKYVQVYMTSAEFELLEEMANAAAMSKTEFMRQMFLRDGDTFRNRQDAAKSLQLAA